MADVEIVLGFTNEQAAKLAPTVERRALAMGRHPKVLALLNARGIESVESLTPKQQLRLLLTMKLMQWVQSDEHAAHEEAGNLAAAAVEDEFPVEVGQ